MASPLVLEDSYYVPTIRLFKRLDAPSSLNPQLLPQLLAHA